MSDLEMWDLVETREIFDAAPLAVGEFLSDTGQGLYIPPYQRAYSWEAAKVKRLIADVAHGLEQMIEFDDSICFLGSVIALRDLQYTTVEPIHRPMVPNKVMTIIDGQQRLTTLLLLTTSLHEEINVRAHRLPGNDDDSVRSWCLNQAIDITSRLTNTFEEDMRWGDPDFRYYPRMIRSYHDVWSRRAAEAKYESPIGYYLHEYGRYARGGSATKEYRHTSFVRGEVIDANMEAHKHLESIRQLVRRTLRNSVSPGRRSGEDDIELLSAPQIASSHILQNALFNSPFPKDVTEALSKDERIASLLRLIVLANYLLSRVTVAVVTAKREDYGFDMFEALNTTGQPLTAIETFKPRAIQHESLSKWNGSDSYKHFDVVEKYLDEQGASSADKRQTATNNILIPFALLHDGTKLSKRLSEQRRYLRERFDKESDSGKRTYLHALAQVTRFISGPWSDSESAPSCEDQELRRQAVLCLHVLREAKHDIVIAPLTRYFAAYHLANLEIVDERAREFLLAVRACGAFYGLWRGAFGGTHGIDDVYRKLMNVEPNNNSNLRFTRAGLDLSEIPPISEMISFLRSQLKESGIDERERWISRAVEVPVYVRSKPLTKFLLLAASDDSTLDPATSGLVIRGRKGLLSTLSLERWRDDAFASIEHIAPQNRGSNEWDAALYDNQDAVHHIGNLTLLPQVENASASNRSWPIKRLMFQALSASTVDEAKELVARASREGIELGAVAQKIVRNAVYLPQVAALARYEGEWTADFVRERSRRLCGLAWDSLAPWLDL